MAENTGGASYKTGIVEAVNGMRARVRFPDLDDLVSGWLHIGVANTLRNKDHAPLDVGEHVACLMDAYFEDGVIVCAIYSDEDLPPVESGDKRHTRFADGGVIEYDRAAHAYLVDVPQGGKLTLRCGPSVIEITADGVKIIGPRLDLN